MATPDKTLETRSPRAEEIELHLLVTDTGAHVFSGNSGDDDLREWAASRARDAVLYERATKFELRKFVITIPLLPPPIEDAEHPAATSMRVDLPPELLALIADVQRQLDVKEQERITDALLRHWPPGTYEFYREGQSHGFRRLQ